MRRTCILMLCALAAGSCAAATLRVAISNPPIGRGNPYQASGPTNSFVAPAIFDALTVVDAGGKLQPGLALSWSSDPGARVWTFRLRPNVTFSNGAPFDADAVVAALTYLTGAPLPSDLVRLEFADVAAFRAVDPLTVEISGRQPTPLLPWATSVLYVVEPATWRRLGPQDFAAQPVGTGPFRVERWGAARIMLAAAEKSWRRPKVENLEFVFQQDATSRLQSLLAGRIDIAVGAGPEDRGALEAAGGRLVPVPVPSVTAIMLLPDKAGSPFADVRVRQAINYAVDKDQLVKSFYGGAMPPAGQPAARTAVGYDPAVAPYPHDPARARALLAGAGRGDGFSFVIEAPVGSTGSDGAIYQQIAQDLASVKVEMIVRSVSGVRFGQIFRTGAWEGDGFAFLYTASPTFDGIRALKYYTCAAQPLVFCDPATTPLFAEAEPAPDIDTRAAVARRIMARYHDQAAALYLYESPGFHGVAGTVRGFRMENQRIAFDEIDVAP